MHKATGPAHHHQGQTARDSESRVRGYAEAHATHPRAARAGDRPQHASHTGKNTLGFIYLGHFTIWGPYTF